jgi:hypothetical protein
MLRRSHEMLDIMTFKEWLVFLIVSAVILMSHNTAFACDNPPAPVTDAKVVVIEKPFIPAKYYVIETATQFIEIRIQSKGN